MKINELTAQELDASRMALSIALRRDVADVTDEDIQYYMDCDYLTINISNDIDHGCAYAWYLDPDGLEACVDVETMKEIDKKQINALF